MGEKWICGHCKGNNVKISRHDDIINDQTIFQVKCDDCKFGMTMPVPNYTFDNLKKINVELEIQKIQNEWDRVSAKAQKPKQE